MLDFIHDLFTKVGISYWLNFGTLLGAVRDGDLIVWDEDVDVGVWHDDVSKIMSLRDDFKKIGYQLMVNTIEMNNHDKYVCSITVYYSKLNLLHMCLTTFITKDGIARCVEYPGMNFPINNIRNPSLASVREHEFPCPTSSEVGLENYYGKDWKTPKIKKWMKHLAESDQLDPRVKKAFDDFQEYDYEPGCEIKPE
jgi:hypothetical protein